MIVKLSSDEISNQHYLIKLNLSIALQNLSNLVPFCFAASYTIKYVKIINKVIAINDN